MPSNEQTIRVFGARQHNLKGVNVQIRRGALTAVTGPSGSGKSSLVFHTLYAEGQRKYIESLSTYAKQFLERMPKPAVDRIEGLPPSVAIGQGNQVQSSRSTVGTVSDIYDCMRLLWARSGITICPRCDRPVRPDSVSSATAELCGVEAGRRVIVAALFEPVSGLSRAATAAMGIRSRGFLRVIADGREVYLGDLGTDPRPDSSHESVVTPLADADELLVVVDRLTAPGDPEAPAGSGREAFGAFRSRLADSLTAAFAEGRGGALVLEYVAAGAPIRRPFDLRHRCAECGDEFPHPEPNLFSFNSAAGACPECKGFGAVLEYTEDLIVPDPGRSLDKGALDPWTKPRYSGERSNVSEFAGAAGIDTGCAWRDLPEADRRLLLEGGRREGKRFRGVVPFLRSRERKKYKPYIRTFLRQYQMPRQCDACGGGRLQPAAANVKVDGLAISDGAGMTILELHDWVRGDMGLTPFQRGLAATVLEEIRSRAFFLVGVGLGYLALDRQARSLSAGEMQRIRLAGCLGSGLTDTLYVLDEPTTGLHPEDTERLSAALQSLADRGNTVVAVEHDATVMRQASEIIELGPKAGADGGEVVFVGSWQSMLEAGSATGKAMAVSAGCGFSGGARLPGDGRWGSQNVPAETSPDVPAETLRLTGGRLHNVQGVDVEVPLGALTVVTGVSGSGKSSLVRGIICQAMQTRLDGDSGAKRYLGDPEGRWTAFEGGEELGRLAVVDQSPVGRSSRSSPVTYIGAFSELRQMYAAQPEARRRGFGAGHFSFNSPLGQCPQCRGTGEEVIEMVFLADVNAPCERCRGSRFRPDVLEIKVRGLSIADALNLTVSEAIRFFIRSDAFGRRLWMLARVGLGYLKLGQPATTLSGGEAQRLKIARELGARARGGGRGRGRNKVLYVLDEPTVGLGAGEINGLVDVLSGLADSGHTVLAVEHNPAFIARADWIIDMGPGAGAGGGCVVARGTPAEIAERADTATGKHLGKWAAEASGIVREPAAKSFI